MALALNKENDIFAENGAIKRIYSGAQVVQHVRSRLLTYLGEWFLDTTAGVPYFENIFIKPVDLTAVESELKTTIIRTPGLGTLDSFSMDFNSQDRKLGVTFGATTQNGDAIGATVNING